MADISSNLPVNDLADGSVSPGTAATVSQLAGGVYNSTPPTLTTGQQAALQISASGSLKVDGSATTQPVSASALPLPSGAATSALQTTGNASLASMDTKTPALGQALAASSVPVVLTAAQLTTLTPLSSVTVTQSSGANLHANIDNFPATQAISAVSLPLPTGAATSALQTTGNTSLASIAAGTPASIGQKPSSGSMSVVIASDQTLNASIAANLDSSYSPDYSNQIVGTSPLAVDASGRLETHATVTTDEGSFRDDFGGSALATTLTGTVTFVNGSTTAVGVGTSFTSLNSFTYIKLSSDANSAFAQIASVDSDTQITLSSGYTGTSTSGIAVNANWIPAIGTGGSQTVGSGTLTLASGTTSGSVTSITRIGDYLPYNAYSKFSISQRITNQTAVFGFVDTYPTPSKQAVFLFSGTSNTTVTCQSSFSSAAADIQTTSVTLSNTTTESVNKYEVDLTANRVAFLINGVVVAIHDDHLPGPYDNLKLFFGVQNTAVAASSTSMVIDYVFFSNVDQIEVTNNFTGEPIPTTLYGSSSTTGLPTQLQLDANGNLIVTALSGFNSAFSFGDVTTSATTQTAVRRTAYTEQTTNAQRSFKSASANDTSAGTGAQQLTITYLDSSGNGPYTEVVTLNGTTAVATVSTTICYVESIAVTRVGSGASNAGIISMYANALGTGTVIGTINAGDNQTFWAHHYVPISKTCKITGISVGSTTSVIGNGSTFVMKSRPINVTGAVERQVSDFVQLYGQASTFSRSYTSPIQVVGPARLVVYSSSLTASSVTYRAAFDYFTP